MNTMFFKVVGGFVLFIDVIAFLCGLGFLNHSITLDLQVLLRGSSILIPLTVIGIGLMFDRLWAAVLGSALGAFLAVRCYWITSGFAHSADQMIGVAVSVALLIPLAGTIKYWRALKPAGRCYF